MIDFSSTIFQRLSLDDNEKYEDILSKIMISGESPMITFSGVRDGIVFTDRRIIAVNVQGTSGKKIDVTSIPYSKIQSFSIETCGKFDFDSELTIWVATVGSVRFQFSSNSDIYMIGKFLSDFCI